MSQLGKTEGILPILYRFVAEGGGGPVSVFRKLDARGAWDVAHTVDDEGEVDRLIMILTTEVWGRVGRTNGPPPRDAGEPIRVGRLYAEHVFTRPFAARDERKVRALPEGFGLPAVPERRIDWTPAESLAGLPDGVTPLEPAPRTEGAPLSFGLGHTDSNQHVNSLVHPRVFEEAGLGRLRDLGRGEDGPLPSAMELAFRKPCFAGDRVRVSAWAFEDAGRDAIAASLLPADESASSVYATGRFWF